MKAMHAICHYRDGRPDHLTEVGKGQGTFRSGHWRLSTVEAASLSGGWLYLHENSKTSAYFIARIQDLEGPDREGKYIILVRKSLLKVAVRWRGRTPTPSNYVSIVPADQSHEAEAV